MNGGIAMPKPRRTPAKKGAVKSTHDAFFSHASQDLGFALPLAKALEGDGLRIWIDGDNIEVGALLREGLQSAIQCSGVLVLFWSEHALKSRWVMTEIFTAFHSNRFILPVVLDATPLPQFLARTVYLDRKRDGGSMGEKLSKAIRTAPAERNEAHFFIGTLDEDTQTLMNAIGQAQYQVMDLVLTDRKKAAKASEAITTALETLVKLAAMHPMTLNLQGYQCKNAYLVKHWEIVQAGRKAQDPLLEQGEHYFFEALCLNPTDVNAVNGLGSILICDLELNAAEFFVRRSLEVFKAAGIEGTYAAADSDLRLILRLKGQQQAGVY